eukprot:GHVL01024846.1.p1 GENE.GHVL01024846.1~~GHVL01024846.1.p1  ORF type:complete len:601 (+),score=60.52 GHVL01024846.1:122-1924(+)
MKEFRHCAASSDDLEVYLYDDRVLTPHCVDSFVSVAGYQSLIVFNNNEESWDILYLGLATMHLVVDYELYPTPPSNTAQKTNRLLSSHSINSSEPALLEKGQLIVRSLCFSQKVIYCPVGSMLRVRIYTVMAPRGIKAMCKLVFSGTPLCLPPIQLQKNPFKKDGARILCIDGGGVLGFSTLRILARIEKELQDAVTRLSEKYRTKESLGKNRTADVQLCDYFDLLAGTSTGGIIALFLLAGLSVSEVTRLYTKLYSGVFDGSRNAFAGLLTGGYSTKPFKQLLMDYIGHDVMNSIGLSKSSTQAKVADSLSSLTYRTTDNENFPLYCFVVSTDVRTQPYQLYLLRNYEHIHTCQHEHAGSSKCPLWAAAWATASAPTYLKGPTSEELADMGVTTDGSIQLVDGALKANNPAFVALEEAARLSHKTVSQFVESDLSLLGSLPVRLSRESGSARTLDIVLNFTHLITASMNIHQEIVQFMPDGWDKYFRFNVPGIGDIPLDSHKKTHLDIIQRETVQYLADEKHYDIKRLARSLAKKGPRRKTKQFIPPCQRMDNLQSVVMPKDYEKSSVSKVSLETCMDGSFFQNIQKNGFCFKTSGESE